mmetsp:Transcript_15936/g.23822  ORF Transcript_15936/g.23822 Transcript_15936/m.23822 type:complete len:204 (-) Transcript_15936:237-848(-)|eukprot:CAMPEP_0201545622 /NCGR_PEP_ID=MMETSP0173_2-20130828/2072_1 /ASSEMBLY_ACC=CAM_ASM_000268 /TAXON_ID=218659 /ORGANISM="Vexillifera sp., Strain DIVA3 564/2" /LENGTH=203 /DNA_ID=CAMNT_0047954065 /DNA_START=72 /DNA_END=683 /DNA_ORIENTATION=+
MVFEKRIVIDTRNHLLGRLASIIAKELLAGQQIVAVRCEQINISGTHKRNRLKYQHFLRKRTNTNPKKGPIHFRAPSKILWRTVRGMLPHKTARGAAALGRLKVFEGVPPPYDKVKRVVCPEALRPLRLKPGRPYTVLGRLSSEVGWKYADVVEKLEQKRLVRAQAWYLRKKAINGQKAQAREETAKALPEVHQSLKDAGYVL